MVLLPPSCLLTWFLSSFLLSPSIPSRSRALSLSNLLTVVVFVIWKCILDWFLVLLLSGKVRLSYCYISISCWLESSLQPGLDQNPNSAITHTCSSRNNKPCMPPLATLVRVLPSETSLKFYFYLRTSELVRGLPLRYLEAWVILSSHGIKKHGTKSNLKRSLAINHGISDSNGICVAGWRWATLSD